MTKLNNTLSTQEHVLLPAQPVIHQKGQNMAQASTLSNETLKEVNAMTTRSGHNLDSKPTTMPTPISDANVPKSIPVKVPFPQALQSSRKELENQGEILDLLQQVKITLPLLHVIKQISAYTKFIKGLCTMKQKHHVKETAFLT